MAIDIEISKAIFFLRLIERAIHDPAEWTARFGNIEVPCRRIIEDSGVELFARFPHGEVEVEGDVVILSEGEVIGSVPVILSRSGEFTFRWALTLDYSLAR